MTVAHPGGAVNTVERATQNRVIAQFRHEGMMQELLTGRIRLV